MLNPAYQLDVALREWGNAIQMNFGDADIPMDQDQFE